MTEPRRELEIQGRVGEPVALPVSNVGTPSHVWTLELPPEVELAGTAEGRLLVRSDRAGSYVLTATLADATSSTPMTVLPIRLTLA